MSPPDSQLRTHKYDENLRSSVARVISTAPILPSVFRGQFLCVISGFRLFCILEISISSSSHREISASSLAVVLVASNLCVRCQCIHEPPLAIERGARSFELSNCRLRSLKMKAILIKLLKCISVPVKSAFVSAISRRIVRDLSCEL